MKQSRIFGSAAFLLAACAGEAADLGDGPLGDPPPSPAAGELSITCESGIDCQDGQCASCFLETCFCDSSAEVALGGCVAPGAMATEPVVSDDGQAMAFAVCREYRTCRSYYWTAATGRQEIPAAGSGLFPTAISGDGQLVLLSPRQSSQSLETGVTTDGQFVLIPGPPRDPDTFVTWVYRVGGGVTATGLMASLPGNGSWQLAKLSAGGVVIGLTWAENGSQQLARWTEERGLEPLATFPVAEDDFPLSEYGWRTLVQINDVTPDGSAIVGMYDYAPVLWTDAGGVQSDLAPLPESAASIMAISRDGSTLVGAMYTRGEIFGADLPTAFRWRRDENTLTELGPVSQADDGSGLSSPSIFVNDDGSVVGGLLDEGERGNYPFRWTAQSGVVHIGQHAAWTYPNPFVSGDGAVVGNRPNGSGAGSGSSDASSLMFSLPYHATIELPRRFVLGPISALAHAGVATVGIGQCGGVDAVYRMALTWEE